MDVIDTPQKGRLRGRAILLSASLPPEAERATINERIEAAEAIEEAVVSLARAAFSEEGTLIFADHPTISPLVALVAREYVTPPVAECLDKTGERSRAVPHVEIYQSEAYLDRIAGTTQRLKQQPGVAIHSIPRVGGETADPDVRDKPQAPKSMKRMRSEMVQRIDLVGMVCIGGMEDVEEVAKLFQKYKRERPIYFLETTGGAAKRLAHNAISDGWLRVPERGVRERVEAFWKRECERKENGDSSQSQRPFAVPYAYIAGKIIGEIINLEDRGNAQLAR